MKMIMMSSQNNLQKSVNRWQLRIGVAKKFGKIAGVIFLVIVLLNILLIIFNMSVSKNVSTDSSTTFIEIGEDDVIDVE